ncbi:alpha/beta hydrolase [Candidatus Xianfuyuplasma coldseepsis]|uniref:Alpha/beta hydrolase n=1 Tax=Candidatus Xianfuyuplasma coldseepsis TaxID=2782163 RepID=A0A7L7KS81_9MOLU|nr:alpha/beta hydrolase-fold protein [Xianfuyuplasma coldseepsis]QMS85680.1 alpha/beta hydrolase [Xianfuyuplasma coldseepsis]
MKEYRTIRMYSEQLSMEKRLYVYLPRSYESSEKFYPVLYMHDGQNLFDDRIAYQRRGWRIMELYEEYPDIPEVIIVGIESDITRNNQLIPYPFQLPNSKKVLGGQADLYLDFIVQTVKPYIDQRFRTYKNRKNTAIMGSSFGGVNSLYASCKYTDTFARIASLSGAFHFDFFEPLKQDVLDADFSSMKKIYMDCGTNETDNVAENKRYIERNQELVTMIQKKTDTSQFQFQMIEGGIHHETDWEKRFPDIMRFLFND